MDLRGVISEAISHLLQSIQLHKGALIAAAPRIVSYFKEDLIGGQLTHLVEDAWFRQYNEPRRITLLNPME